MKHGRASCEPVYPPLRTLPCRFWEWRIIRTFFCWSTTPLLSLPRGFRPRPGITLVVGASGSGKSVLLSFLAGYPMPGTRVALTERKGQKVRMRQFCDTMPCVYLPQRFPEIVRGQLLVKHLAAEIGQAYKGRLECSQKVFGEEVQRHLVRCGLGDVWEKDLCSLSGGERQRVELLIRLALVPVLTTSRMLLILDEPTTGLDPRGTKLFLQEIESVLQALPADRTCYVIVATHAPAAAPNSLALPLLAVQRQEASDSGGRLTVRAMPYDSAQDFLRQNSAEPGMDNESSLWQQVYSILGKRR